MNPGKVHIKITCAGIATGFYVTLLAVLVGCTATSSIPVLKSGNTSGEDSSNAQASPQCVAIPNSISGFGHIKHEDIKAWVGLDQWHYTTNPGYLEIGLDEVSGSYLRQRLAPMRNGSVRVLGLGEIKPFSSYTLTQSLYLESGFDWGGSNEGGKIGFGLGGGSTPTGGQVQADGFSARLMWRGNNDGTARMAVYAYSADRSQNLPYGDDYTIKDFLIPVGKWFTVTMKLTANSHTVISDGEISIWVDNKLKLNRKNILWQSAGKTPTIDSLLYATFHGGNDASWSPDREVYARFNNICWQAPRSH